MSGIIQTPHDELFDVATQQLMLLEARVAQVKRDRRMQLERHVFLDSDIRFFFYTTDEHGYIAIAQDAPFIALALVISGNTLGIAQNTTAENFSVSIEDLGQARQVTSGSDPFWPPNAATLLTPSAVTLLPNGGLTVPLEEFTPAYRQGDDNGIAPANVDCWHVLGAQYLIPKGDTLRVLYKPVTGVATPPELTLCGFKVMS